MLVAVALGLTAVSAGAARDPREAAVDAVFERVDHPDTPGCAVGVGERGATVYARGFGMADLGQGTPITRRSVFDIASVSKQLTAAVTFLLVAEGRVALTDLAERWVPELPDVAAGVTIEQLIHHTSGLPDYTVLLDAGDETRTTNADALGTLDDLRHLRFEPGARFEYSNTNYMLLAVVAERASGQGFRGLLAARVLEPLGMRDTFVRDDATEPIPRGAVGYTPRRGEFIRDVSSWQQTGDGAVQTTVDDLLRWAGNLSSFSVGGAALRAAMFTPGRRLDQGIGYGGGLSIDHDRDEALLVEHSGAWAGYTADLVARPDDGVAVVVLCNRADVDPATLAARVLRRWRSGQT